MTSYSYISKYSSKIEEYVFFRISIGYSDHHGKILQRFDRYCAEFHPNASSLTKEIVRGWLDYEVASGCTGLDAKASTIRSFARYVGGDSYILPNGFVPKRPISFLTSSRMTNCLGCLKQLILFIKMTILSYLVRLVSCFD